LAVQPFPRTDVEAQWVAERNGRERFRTKAAYSILVRQIERKRFSRRAGVWNGRHPVESLAGGGCREALAKARERQRRSAMMPARYDLSVRPTTQLEIVNPARLSGDEAAQSD